MGLLLFDIGKWAVPGDCPLSIQKVGSPMGLLFFRVKSGQSPGTAHFYKGLPTFSSLKRSSPVSSPMFKLYRDIFYI